MRAFVISEHEGALLLEVREVQSSPTDDGDVLVQVDYSGVNFKDAMAATAGSRVRRIDTLVGGIDAAQP